MKRKKLSLTTQYVAVISALVLIINLVLGAVLLKQSNSALRTLIHNHMVEVTKTAADLIDGDELEKLQSDAVGTEEFDAVFDKVRVTLLAFMKNNDVEYVYAVRATKPEDHKEYKFEFTVDPDPDDPAQFGEEVEAATIGLYRAYEGIASVDDEPAADEWGNFYSAWAPIYNSKGSAPENIVGVVGVDFGVDWYESQITQHTVSVAVIGVLSVIAGGVVVLLITGRLRKRFRVLSGEITSLSSDVEGLLDEITASPGFAENVKGSVITAEEDLRESENESVESEADGKKNKGDTIDNIGSKIRLVQKELRVYIDFVHAQAYADTMTGVANKTAYLEKVQSIDREIAKGDATVSTVVFDVNGLKNVNDNYGHEVGDKLLTDAATVIKRVFGAEHTYRIGGDEFIVILENVAGKELSELLVDLDKELRIFNAEERRNEVVLAISKGGAASCREDVEFRQVFKRADEAMYKDKAEYYRRVGDRRKHEE